MALITTYATLVSAAADFLNRSDVSTTGIPQFVQNAEARLAKDRRCRRITQDDAFSVTGDDLAAPSGFRKLISMSLDGTQYYGPITVVAPDQIADLKLTHGATGVPAFVAPLRDTDGSFIFRFAPAPDATYTAKLVYEQTVGSCVSAPNWLLTDYPDIYLYAVLAESAPYLKDDSRIAVWEGKLDKLLEDLYQETWDEQWSGSLVRTITPIG